MKKLFQLAAALISFSSFADGNTSSTDRICKAIVSGDFKTVSEHAIRGSFNFTCYSQKHEARLTALQTALWFSDLDQPDYQSILRLILKSRTPYKGEDVEPLLFVNSLNFFKESLSSLKSKGYDINRSAETPLLMIAIGNNANPAITRWLIQFDPDVDINAQDRSPNGDGETALFYAIQKLKSEYVSLITKFRKNLSINYSNRAFKAADGSVNFTTGVTAITYAFQNYVSIQTSFTPKDKTELMKIMKILIQAGADPSLKGPAGLCASELRVAYFPFHPMQFMNSDESLELHSLLK